jgi:hypothetical protein
VSLFELEDGKSKEQADYDDAAGFLIQLGVELDLPALDSEGGGI